LAAAKRGQEAGARAREEDPIAGSEIGLGLHAAEELQHLLGLARVVALVVLPERLAVLDEDGLDGRGADVDARRLHPTRPSFAATSSTRLAAVPVTTPRRGTR